MNLNRRVGLSGDCDKRLVGRVLSGIPLKWDGAKNPTFALLSGFSSRLSGIRNPTYISIGEP
jgi:hypothetical protein